jgi:type III pantothenate kinase
LFKVAIASPTSAIGKTTEDALRSGLYYGTIGAVDEIVSRIARDLGGTPKVIATDGPASLMADGSPDDPDGVDPILTLKTPRVIWLANRL